jgi:PhnB protein
MPTINPYLNFPGKTEEAFNFYKSVFGGDFSIFQRYKETPMAGNVPVDDQEKIMHVSLPIGQGTVLMASDTLESIGQTLVAGNNMSLSVGTESEAEATRLFEGLSMGGKIEMPMQKTFWGSFFGMVTDRFGVRWMISYEYK